MERLDTKDSSVVLVMNLQSINELCVLEVLVNPPEKYDSSAKSMFHWRILKCRQLIFSEPEVIASPLLKTNNKLYVIMTSTFYKTGRILNLLTKFRMSAKKPTPVSKFIYECCLRYTLCARIAPLWNQVGCYLVRGRDFLVSNSSLEAVKLDISVNGSTAFITLWPVKIKLQQTNIEDLDIPRNIIADFLSQKTNNISEIHLSQRVHILPSLKTCRMVRISQNVPDSCPYPSYKDLKRHWKNMYGYRLPEDETNILYYSVSFHPMNPTSYTYPSICVQSQNILLFSPRNNISILRCFHNDLLAKMSNVCGEAVETNEKLACALPDLYPSNLFVENTNDQNFVNLQYKGLDILKNDVIETKIKKKNPAKSLASSDELDKQSQRDIFCSQISQSVSQEVGSSEAEKENIQPKFIPVFTGKLCKNESRSSETEKKNIQPKVKPVFTGKLCENEKRSSETEKENIQPKVKPVFTGKLCENEKRSSETEKEIIQPKVKPVFTGKLCKNENKSFVKNQSSTVQSPDLSMDIQRHPLLSSHYSNMQQNASPVLVRKVQKGTSQNEMIQEVPPPASQNEIKTFPLSTMPATSAVSSSMSEVGFPGLISFLGNDLQEPVTKKARTRPQVQFDVDVELLARNNELARVNTATLVHWLRERQIPCRVKDKKSELVDKVMTCLNLNPLHQ